MVSPAFRGPALSPEEVKLLELAYDNPVLHEEELAKKLRVSKKDLKEIIESIVDKSREPDLHHAATRAKQQGII